MALLVGRGVQQPRGRRTLKGRVYSGLLTPGKRRIILCAVTPLARASITAPGSFGSPLFLSHPSAAPYAPSRYPDCLTARYHSAPGGRQSQGDPVGVILLSPSDPPFTVGVLPCGLVLPCQDPSRVVQLSYQSYRHICERRETGTPELLDLVLGRLSMVIANPTHVGNLSGDENKIDLFAWSAGDPAGVLVCIKCLKGESWVCTAFPLGRKSLRKHVNTGRLKVRRNGA